MLDYLSCVCILNAASGRLDQCLSRETGLGPLETVGATISLYRRRAIDDRIRSARDEIARL